MQKITLDARAMSEKNNPHLIGFLLLNDFTLLSLASAVEPLRMANQLTGKELYRWVTLSEDGHYVIASDGLKITPDASIRTAPAIHAVIVCGGINIQHQVNREHVKWLKSQARTGKPLGAVCTGSWALAEAGLLDGYVCSIHWECVGAMREAFSLLQVSNHLYFIDRDRYTASGGTAPMDMMLNLIGRSHGFDLSSAISEMFIYERMRSGQDQQRVPLRHTLGTSQPKLQKLVMLMEDNLEEPVKLDYLAYSVNISRRQLERLFNKYLSCSPSRYYLKLRLVRAHQLLKQTFLSTFEISLICGFVSFKHFSRCYRDYFGVSPHNGRIISDSDSSSANSDDAGFLYNSLSSAAIALNRAKGESTFATVKI